MKRLISYLLCLLITCPLLCCPVVASAANDDTMPEDWPGSPKIFAETGVLIEASTATVLYNKKMHKHMYPASITKVLTALVALENSKLDAEFTFSHDAVYSLQWDDAHIGMKEGEKLSLENCLYGLLLASANEVANAIAENVAGSKKDFAKMMNERATQAGATDSHFANPSGLFDEKHYTSAYDMAMITKDAIKNPAFMKIEACSSYTIPKTKMTNEERVVNQRHKMCLPNDYRYYEGIQGGKTGYVDESGNTLITIAKRGDLQLISVVMNSDTEHVYSDTKSLLDYGFENFSTYNIADNESQFSFENSGFLQYVTNSFSAIKPVVSLDSKGLIILPKDASFSDASFTLVYNENTSPSQNSDVQNSTLTNIGTLEYTYKGKSVGSTSLFVSSSKISTENTKQKENETKSKEVKKNKKPIFLNIGKVILVLLIVIAIILLIVYYLKIRSQRKHRPTRHNHSQTVKSRKRRIRNRRRLKNRHSKRR